MKIKTRIPVRLIFSFMLLLNGSAFAQFEQIDIHQVDEKLKENKKPVFILITAEWCKYCFMQQNIIQKRLRKNKSEKDFYFTQFDLEYKDPIIFNGKRYHYEPYNATSGEHELATALIKADVRAFPIWIIMSDSYKVMDSYMGVLTNKELDFILGVIRHLENKPN